jgi:1,4-dihydroxy-2-naphthoyl-CoA hydrolase
MGAEEIYPDDDGDRFNAFLGIEFGDMSADRVTGEIDVDSRHHQPNGIVHGGVYAGFVETLASYGAAIWAHENFEGRIAVGLSNTTDFLRAHRDGRLSGIAEPVHRGRTQQLWQVAVTRVSDGKLVARGQVRLQNVSLDELASRG